MMISQLRQMRDDMMMTQDQFAFVLGVKNRHKISDWERGHTKLTDKSFGWICKRLGEYKRATFCG